MVDICDYSTDLGEIWRARRVQVRHIPLVEGAEDERDSVLPDDLNDLFTDSERYCPDYRSFRQRKIKITQGNSEYLVTLPVLVDSPEFLAIKDALINEIGVDKVEVVGEKIPFPVLQILV